MWRCSNCDTDNSDENILCNSCDWHSPTPLTFEAVLLEGKEVPTYNITWDFDHTTKVNIGAGIGPVSTFGETNFTITRKTILVFICENEHARKEFSIILLLPSPTIENFTASVSEISLGKPISLSWVTKYADKVLLSDFGEVTGSTHRDVLLRRTSSITLTVENSSGKQERSIPFILPLPKILDFVCDDKKPVSGNEIILSWKSTNIETLALIALGKEEILTGENKKIILYESTTLKLIATNESGTTEKELIIEVVPKPEIKALKLSKTIALVNDEIEVLWEAVNFSKLFLQISEDVLDVSDKTSFKFKTNKSEEIKLVCEAFEKLAIISQTVSVRIIERVTVNYLTASSYFTVQSKPVLLSWSVSNATEINLLPTMEKLVAKGSVSLLPSIKTVFVVEAKNELTTDRKEIEIDVLPLPSISNILLAIPPKINLPVFYENKVEYPISKKPKSIFLNWFKDYIRRKYTIKEPKTLKTTFISFNQRSEYIEISRETSIMRIVSSIKKMSETELNIINLKN